MKARPITTVKTIVAGIEDGGAGIKLFTLTDPDQWELPPFKPGAHIDLHLPNGIVRTYSLCNEPADNRRYVIAVKREGDGRGGSRTLHDEVGTGDVIGVSLPRGGLESGPDFTRYVFVAGGIGVTPFLSMARHLERTGQAVFTAAFDRARRDAACRASRPAD
jgi:ferredoxin-NADP reductase